MTARAALALVAALAGCAEAPSEPVVFAAASTADVVRALAEGASVSVAASSVLARQVARGAPASVLVTADPAWIDWLAAEGVPVLDRREVARGSLVVVGPADAAPEADPFTGRIALADPAHVPAGQYARAALRASGRWADVEPRTVRTGDVRAALAAVEAGAADRAVVYASDARASTRVRVLLALDGAGAIRFEAALLKSEGRSVFDALTTRPEAWAAAGFLPPAP